MVVEREVDAYRDMILKPILLPEVNQMGNVKTLMGEFGELVRELPESKYLFDEDDDDTTDEDEKAPDDASSDEEGNISPGRTRAS